MLSTDIFKFEFVDRTRERQIIDNFIGNFSETTKQALWIHGERGTGKSFLLTEYVVPRKDFSSIYVNVEVESNTPFTYLKKLITKINEVADLKFTNFIRTNYKSIGDVGQQALSIVLNILDINDLQLDKLSYSISNYFISKQGERENTISVVKKYILEALKKCPRLVFIFDNFTQCDTSSLDIIASVTHEGLDNPNIRFIFCTTDDDITDKFDVLQILTEKIANIPVEICAFEEKQLFVRMLEQTFDFNEENLNLLSQTFDLCKGYPQRFKEILINLYTNQGIELGSNKARFIIDVFHKILLKRTISFDIDSLCQEQRGAKIILQTIAFWGAPISVKILFQFLDFFANIDPISFVEKETGKTIQMLENLHVLTRSYKDNIMLLHFEHDSLKIAVKEYFKNERSIQFLHLSIYEFIKLVNCNQEQSYWNEYYRSLLAYHSFEAGIDGWIEYNFSYGYEFFNNKLYIEAEAVFTRLDSVITSLSGEQILTIGITLFYCGQYHKANDLFKNILKYNLTNNFSEEQIIELYIFQARASSCILDTQSALAVISQAENLNIVDDDERLQVMLLGTKQSILYLSPNGFSEAKTLFDDLTQKKIHTREMALIYQSAMDYYEGEEALKLLDKGLTLAKEFGDRITEAKILNNIGFEHLRIGNYEEAQTLFEESIAILVEEQPHEQVYPNSNLAVLYMISRNWEKALECIIEALFWNKSDYVSYVLKTNRMLCYYFTNNAQWNNLYHELFKYVEVERNIDDKMYKKICINLAILAAKNEDSYDVKKLLKLCSPHLENEWEYGKYRFLKLEQSMTGVPQVLPTPLDPRYVQYYCDIEFEPWLVNFTHD